MSIMLPCGSEPKALLSPFSREKSRATSCEDLVTFEMVVENDDQKERKSMWKRLFVWSSSALEIEALGGGDVMDFPAALARNLAFLPTSHIFSFSRGLLNK